MECLGLAHFLCSLNFFHQESSLHTLRLIFIFRNDLELEKAQGEQGGFLLLTGESLS